MTRQEEKEDYQAEKNGEETEKGKSYESLEIADRRVTSDVPGCPLQVGSG